MLSIRRFSQVLKGAVGKTLYQNEAELKFSMEIDHQISSTDQAGKVRLTELIINDMSLMSKFSQSISLLVLWLRSGGNFHRKLYFCLILAECRANCSFQGLIIAYTYDILKMATNSKYVESVSPSGDHQK